ncbi:MAG: c-type cytochrome [candidate division Zixibacteria bacterium]|nr:c-type cytochrome [candidate division Zixibacteria bacterium]
MKPAPLILALGAVVLVAGSCARRQPPQNDVLMKTITNFEEVVDAPLAHGKQVYSRYCAVCHGLEGKGDGFNAFNVKPRPRDFTDSAFVTRLDTALIVETISKGGRSVGLSSAMPPWGRTLSEADVRSAAGYVRYLARSAASAKPASDTLSQ